MATKTKKSKKPETLLDNEGSSSAMIEKNLKRALPTDIAFKGIKVKKTKKTQSEQSEQSEQFIVYPVDDMIQKTNNDNDELKKLLISKELIDVREEQIIFKKYKNSEIINLPRLSENKLQNRMHIRKGKLPFIYRRNCNEIFCKVLGSIEEQNASRGLYIFGPSGLGKSYSIYYLVAQFRLYNNLRVTYINSCEEWWRSHEDEPYEFLLNELICTFSNDELSPLNVADWIEFVNDGLTKRLSNKFDELKENSKYSNEERFKTFITGLRKYVREKEYLWVWVFDQHNALHKYNALAKYPFSLVKTLPTRLDEIGLIIVSVSANNEVYPKEFESWEKFSMYSGYTDDEFLEWCKMRNYEIDRDPQLKSQLDSIRFWTNSYPLELDLWHWHMTNADGSSLVEETSKYLRMRGTQIKSNYQTFRKSLDHNELISLNSCVVSMILGSTSPGAIYGMNRQFMYEKSVSEGGDSRETIVAIHPLAQQAIIDSHSEHPLKELRDMVSAVFNKDEYSNDTKGRFAELYIKMLLEYTKTLECKIT
ncbi:hypothetical protein F8M41_008559 [Gigaspora margarita]|uniref:Uncharacterized protein n=1 Tax=Gigaspora margarita TaxID=4874 RepID=A0A8H4ER04_GIGMA|nr:hypothetical protein F8M41_008559 [Gigaspora margarita]